MPCKHPFSMVTFRSWDVEGHRYKVKVCHAVLEGEQCGEILQSYCVIHPQACVVPMPPEMPKVNHA